MRKVRNITVAVDPELYRQTRRLAAEYNTSVTDMVRFLLLVMPEALKAARYPGGRPQFGIAPVRAVRDAAADQTEVQLTAAPSATSANTIANETQAAAHSSFAPNSFTSSQLAHSIPLSSQKRESSCMTVKPTQTVYFQLLAALR